MERNLIDEKVAIIIALYNDAANIDRAIRSAAAQTLPAGMALDIIVVDDCSTDNSFEVASAVCAEFETARVFQLEQNGGPSCARNEALRQTDAAWFLPLDSDDALDPDRLQKLLHVAKAEEAQIVADNLFITHADRPFEIIRPLWPSKPNGIFPLSAEVFVRRCYDVEEERSELGYLKPLISRAALAEAPYASELRFAEDYELYTRMLLDGAKAVMTDGFGYYFIQRDFSSSRSQSTEEHRKVAMIDEAFLKRDDLSAAEREAIQGHLSYSRREWANWTVIEAFRERSFSKLMSSFSISPHAFGFLIKSVFQKLSSRRAGE